MQTIFTDGGDDPNNGMRFFHCSVIDLVLESNAATRIRWSIYLLATISALIVGTLAARLAQGRVIVPKGNVIAPLESMTTESFKSPTSKSTSAPDAADVNGYRFEFANLEFKEIGAISQREYRLERRTHSVKVDACDHLHKLSYAVLTRNGRDVRRFMGFEDSGSNETRFASFAFLGDGTNQFLIEQTEEREWNYVIVDTRDGVHVIFDGRKYKLSGGLSVIDLDGDGIHELIQGNGTFEYFGVLGRSEQAFIDAVFKYDPRRNEYLPANIEFSEYLLIDLEKDIARVANGWKYAREHEGLGFEDTNGLNLNIVFRLIYAGKESEGWKYFRQHCSDMGFGVSPESIQAELLKDLVYRFGRRSNRFPRQREFGR